MSDQIFTAPDADEPFADEAAVPAPEEPGASFDELNLLRNVPLEVVVELGRTRMPIRDFNDLKPGGVIPLDKVHGEPLDILVNNRLVARGEVLMIDDDTYGIRIKSIVPQND